MATKALDGADRIVVLTDDFGQVHEVFPNVRYFDRKLARTNVGVNAVTPAGRPHRRDSIGRLGATIAGMDAASAPANPNTSPDTCTMTFEGGST